MQNAINHKWFFNHAPEAVWGYLTTPELIELWLMKTDLKPVVGHKFMFHMGPLPQFNFDGEVYCEIMKAEPYNKLVYSWKGGPGGGVFTLDSVVTWTLTPKNNGTELELVHSGFEEGAHTAMFQAMNAGWFKNVEKIITFLNNKQ